MPLRQELLFSVQVAFFVEAEWLNRQVVEAANVS